MDQELKGKVAIVTGATSGIGRATALRFADAGARVMAVGRNAQKLKEVVKEIEGKGGEALSIRADVTVQPIARRVVAQTTEAFGGVDILVNAAGHIANGTIENTPLASWDAMLNVNLRAVFNLMQQAVPSLIERRGNIVNVSSELIQSQFKQMWRFPHPDRGIQIGQRHDYAYETRPASERLARCHTRFLRALNCGRDAVQHKYMWGRT